MKKTPESFIEQFNTASKDGRVKVDWASIRNVPAEVISSAMEFKGDYKADTNTPNLDSSPTAGTIFKGDTYVVIGAGTFYTVSVEIGDMLIAEQDDPVAETHWTVVQANLTPIKIKSAYESNANTNAFTDAEQTKLAGIETAATADQTGAEIKSLYEAEANTNAFTDAEQSKLDAIEALADVTDAANVTSSLSGAVITGVTVAGTDKVLIQDVDDVDNLKTVTAQSIADLGAGAPTTLSTGTVTDTTYGITSDGGADDVILAQAVASTSSGVMSGTDKAKLDGIESGATADQTGAEIKSAYEAEANTNAFTDAEQTKLAGIETAADVTDAANVTSSLSGAVITSATVAGTDKVLIQDADDTDNLKTVTAQSIADLSTSGIDNVVEDTTPQLGGMLDVNGNSIGDGTLELLSFVETGLAVNELTITNAAAAGSPSLTATGDDVDIDLTLDGKGTGTVKTTSSNLDITGNIVVSGTVDGRDVATDGTKLDGVEALADVTDEANVVAALNGATLTGVTVATGDKVLVQDADDADNLKTVTTQAVADLKVTEVSEDTTPVLGGDLDLSGNAVTDTQGTPNTGITAVTTGDGRDFTTVLTVSQTDALTLADNAALADGYLLWTFPAGAIYVKACYMSMAITAASTEIQSDTPDVGIGTAEATGAVATLDAAGANAESLLTGQTATNANGTATVKTVGTGVVIESGDNHTVYFNVADTWADDTGLDLTADISGTVTLHWVLMS